MNYPDPHEGAILTSKTRGLDANQAMYGTNEEIAEVFYEIIADGNLVFEILEFARQFFLDREELFTTYEEIWLHPKDLDEFSRLYKKQKNDHGCDAITETAEFKKLEEFIEIAKMNKQPIIFVT